MHLPNDLKSFEREENAGEKLGAVSDLTFFSNKDNQVLRSVFIKGFLSQRGMHVAVDFTNLARRSIVLGAGQTHPEWELSCEQTSWHLQWQPVRACVTFAMTQNPLVFNRNAVCNETH